MLKETILFIAQCKFPSGDAAAIRFENLGLAFKKMGYKVVYVGVGNTPCRKVVHTRFGDVISPIKAYKRNFFSRVAKHIGLEKRIIKFAKNNYPDAKLVIVSGGFAPKHIKSLYRFFAKRGGKVVLSMMEEYTKFELEGVHPYLKNKMVKTNRYYINRFYSNDIPVMAISSYLEEKFKKRGMNAIRVPFVFDESYEEYPRPAAHDGVNLIYCGTPMKKDDLFIVIKALAMIESSLLRKIKLNIAGIQEDWLLKQDGGQELLEKLHDVLIFHGRQPRECIKQLYSMSDFSILIRDPEQPATKAGFPTKVSESLYFGIPVIANVTSDLGLYLEDCVNSLIVPSYSVESVRDALERAIMSSGEKILEMRKGAKRTSREKLSTDYYADVLKRLAVN